MKINIDAIKQEVQPKLDSASNIMIEVKNVDIPSINIPDNILESGATVSDVAGYKNKPNEWADMLKVAVNRTININTELQKAVTTFEQAENAIKSAALSAIITITGKRISDTIDAVNSAVGILNSAQSFANTVKGFNTDKGSGNNQAGMKNGVSEPHIDDSQANRGMEDTELDGVLTFANTNEFFDKLVEGTESYGINSEAFKDLQEIDPLEYEILYNSLINNYKLSESGSEELLNLIGESNDGSYSRGVNAICAYFKDDSETFEEIFGFPLYEQSGEGEWKLNDKKLLLDYYFWDNAYGEDATLIEIQEDGSAILNEDAFEEQRSADWQELNSYLQWKSENLSCISEELCSNQTTNYTGEELGNAIEKYLGDGKELSVKISASGEENAIPFYNVETGNVAKNVTDGEWFKVTGSTEDGIIVSGWGKKCIVKYEDIAENSEFTFISDEISVKS